MTDNVKFTINYGVHEFKPPEYWYEDGRIYCSTGTSIGYGEHKMTEMEAIELASLGGIRLKNRAAAEIGKQKE
jgi:hypothetical protein